MADKDYYDDHLNTETLIFTNLKEEAETAMAEILATTKDLKKISQIQERKKVKKAIKEKLIVGRMKKVAYNVKSGLNTLIYEIVNKDCINTSTEYLT